MNKGQAAKLECTKSEFGLRLFLGDLMHSSVFIVLEGVILNTKIAKNGAIFAGLFFA